MIGKSRLIDPVGRSADQYEAPIAIAAIDITMLVDLEEHARMAECCAAGNIAGAVTGDTAVADTEGFGRGDHEARIARRGRRFNRIVACSGLPIALILPQVGRIMKGIG